VSAPGSPEIITEAKLLVDQVDMTFPLLRTATLPMRAGLTFSGAFYARVIEVRPQNTLVCLTTAAAL